MNILAISGSGRASSTNTAMLCSMSALAETTSTISVFDKVADLPVFSPDLEAGELPPKVRSFVDAVKRSDGLIIASPEYVRSIPGGLKNAIDWLVSREEIITKPVVLMHASHRGDDMLAQLRIVLTTVSERFNENIFARFHLMKMPPEEICSFLELPKNKLKINDFIKDFESFCR